MIRRRGVAAFLLVALGGALGVGLANSAVAVADAIDDAWLYGVPEGPGALSSEGTTLPGFPDTGSITNQETQNFGPIALSQDDFNYLHGVGGDPWYSVHDSTFVIPDLYTNESQQVTDLLDTSATYPTVGTVADHSEFISLSSPGLQGVWLMQSYSLNDPDLGSASAFVLPGMSNTLISDAAGIKDIVNFFGQTSTLFEIPFTASGSAAALDLGDGTQQLLTELTNAFPGADALLGLS